jgi:RNA polymerase sigma factor (sigma-70 family)
MTSFERFYEEYEAPVLSFLLRRVRDPELAADLLSETFAAALPHWHAGSGPEPEREAAWIFTIARSKLIDSWRRGQVEDAARRALGMEPVTLEDPDLARILEVGEEPLLELLALLPDEQREAIQARVLDERDYEDVARELRCSPQVARKRVSRGLAVLRTQVRRRQR